MPSIVKPISVEQIESLPTKRLLAYLNKLRACEESMKRSDIDRETDSSKIRFKDDPRWIELYRTIKLELANREHVPNVRMQKRKK